jgi:hypothetical protein
MKKYFAALSATALISVAPYALAASSTDLTVTGKITPAACTPGLSSEGKVDHGKISVKDLHQGSDTPLQSVTLQLTVQCEEAAQFALNPIDNRSGTAMRNDMYGLGLINGDQKLGGYFVQMQNARADGRVVSRLVSADRGKNWTALGHGYMDVGLLYSAGTSSSGTFTPIAAKETVMDIAVKTFISRTELLTLTEEVAIDGSMTLEVKYL